jgi:hypothetical protein
MLDKVPALLPMIAGSIVMLLMAGCATDTSVTSVLPIAGSVLEPDRVVVNDFEVTAKPTQMGAMDRDETVPTAEEVRVGTILAAALSKYLVDDLRNYGIKADLASEAAPLKDNTISINGRFMRTEKGSRSNLVGGFRFADQVRTRIMIFQGTRSFLQFIAQGDTATPTSLKSGMSRNAEATVVDTDARKVAQDVAERIADYYRKRGWLKPR